ncbi:endo alpha-1,4 polygalactosaminidase [Rubritalea spongiae]|uniref:Endo alpha-1,4 polygalactosaminidase n=1 Tax=Rubritalea spongiae TaxID=430797 RepID=A0ABW5E359_9BACT
MKLTILSIITHLSTIPAMLAAEIAWNKVDSWAYQLCNYTNDTLDEITSSQFDLVVIDLSRNGQSDFFKRAEIEAVQQSNKLVLAYFEIGAIEQYRPEWNDVPKDLKAGRVANWPKEQYVKFWDERWWPIVRSRIDQALTAGFNGAYLDMVTTYAEIPNTELKEEERAHKMVELIERISTYAKTKDPSFKIVPQNCPELYTWSYSEPKLNQKYINAIDGLGLESVFFMAHDRPAQHQWSVENRKNAIAIKAANKLVLGVDYAKKVTSIRQAYQKQRALGFIPYVSVETLEVLQIKNSF